jgi:GNAT superfamily N-acetyltransferase
LAHSGSHDSEGASWVVQMDSEDFIAAIQELYVQNPCQVSSIAFWKTAQLCRGSETYSVTKESHTYLYAIRSRRLEFYWSDDRQHFLLTPNDIKAFEFLALHADFYRLIADKMTGFQVRESHPLHYDFGFVPAVETSDEFLLADFDFTREQDLVVAAEMLNRCYETDHHGAEEIAGWCSLAVFDESLWFWVRKRSSGEAVGLGISTYQVSIRECYLDWIQVLPEYQGRGLGRLLVSETIRRAIGKSDIIRVTGMADDFYRKCGFVGNESWRIITKL